MRPTRPRIGGDVVNSELIGRGKIIAERLNAERRLCTVPGSRNGGTEPGTAEWARNSAGSSGSDGSESLLKGLLNAAALDAMTFDPLTEHVPGLVVEGFGVIAGSPKIGKSWLVDDIALGCAYGGMVLGAIPVTPRPVLLASLEDSPRRLQSRLRKLSQRQDLPALLDIITEIQPGLVIATIAEWLLRHQDSAPL